MSVFLSAHLFLSSCQLLCVHFISDSWAYTVSLFMLFCVWHIGHHHQPEYQSIADHSQSATGISQPDVENQNSSKYSSSIGLSEIKEWHRENDGKGEVYISDVSDASQEPFSWSSNISIAGLRRTPINTHQWGPAMSMLCCPSVRPASPRSPASAVSFVSQRVPPRRFLVTEPGKTPSLSPDT